MPRVADRDGVRLLTLDNPPVNAVSFAYSAELLAAIAAAESDPSVVAVLVTGANGLFSAGADVNDFQGESTPGATSIRDVVAAIERSAKTYVAAIDGNCLGGALELALACDYRIASAGAKIGLPEIKLGLLPGAGATQRLPRLIGARSALEFMLKGSRAGAERAAELGMVDEVVSADVVEHGVAFAARVARSPTSDAPSKRRVSAREATVAPGISRQAVPFVVAQAHTMVPAEERGGLAAHKLVDAVAAALELPFAFGLAREERLFDELVRSEPSSALRHLFFAERELPRIPGVTRVPALRVERAGVVGAGTMGSGIAIAFALAGIPVVVVDPNDDAVATARQTVMGTFMYAVKKGRMTQEEAWRRAQSIAFGDDWGELAGADAIVEAVFEDLDSKREVFRKLDAVAKREAILATNTSTLDVDELANATKRPERVVGLHFFVPANIMPLLEIVRGRKTSAETVATAFELGRRLRKKAVPSGNAFGFIGNRMAFDYLLEANALAEEGATPARIDAVMQDFGFPMGPFAMSDLSGIDVGWRIVQSRGGEGFGRTNVLRRLVELNRLGQKTMAGYFRYDRSVGKGREPIADPVVEELFVQEARRAGIEPRTLDDAEIRERLLRALVERGKRLLEEGVALRAGDIDVVYVYGYGFPPYLGGPMWHAGIRELTRA